MSSRQRAATTAVALLALFVAVREEPLAGARIAASRAGQEEGDSTVSALRDLLGRVERLVDEGAADQVAALTEEALGRARSAEDPLAAALPLHDAGTRLLEGGRTAAAAPLLTAALEIREALAPDSLALATSLAGVGALALAQDRLEASREALERALAIRRRSGGALEIAESLHQLGRLAYAEGDLAGAEQLWREVLGIREAQAPDSLELAATLHNLGLVRKDLGDPQSARDALERSLAIKRSNAPRTPDVALTLNALGNVAFGVGQLDLAREYFGDALAIEEVARPGTRYEAGPLNNLGLVAFYQGDYEAALDYYDRALELERRQNPESMGAARTLMNIGWVARDRGDRVAARDYFSEALAIQEHLAPGSLEVARTLRALGTLAHDGSELAAARGFYVRALAIEEERAPDSLNVAMTLDNLGNVERRLGDLEKSEERHRRALVIFERLAPGSIDLSYCLYNLGEAALARGDPEEAQQHIVRAIGIRRRWAPDSLVVAEGLAFLGRVLIERQDLAAAESAFEEAWQIVGLEGQLVNGDEAVRAYANVYRPFASTLVQLQLERVEPASAFRTVEESRAQALLQLMVLRDARTGLVDASSRRGLEEAERELQTARAAVEESAVLWTQSEGSVAAGRGDGDQATLDPEATDHSTGGGAEDAMTKYTRARKEVERRLAELRRSIPALGEGNFDLDSARRTLPAGSVYIAFFVGEQRVMGFVASPDPREEIKSYDIDLSRSELTERISRFREIVWRDRRVRGVGGLARATPAAAAGDDELLNASRELFVHLFPPSVQPMLAASKRWVLSPDDAMWELPFAALASGRIDEGPRWIGLEKALTYTPSLGVFARERGRARADSSAVGSPLVVGDPLLSSLPRDSGESWSMLLGPAGASRSAAGTPQSRWPLPGSRDEAVRVGELYGVAPLLGPAPTELAVRERLVRAPIIHLSSHALFDPARAMSSGVLLASVAGDGAAPSSDGDGVLQAWELGSALPLRAELVVLSACETGRGETTRGEGVVGLTRALQAAGARSVVATHWRIEDRGTADLMVSFHDALLDGLPKDEALRRAMSASASKEETRHPFYWAGFFLTGDPEGLSESLRRGADG